MSRIARAGLHVVELVFGVSRRINRPMYALTGVVLMLVKYGGEALAIGWLAHEFFAPWDFLNPVMSVRLAALRSAPDWLGWGLFAWTLPFMWVAITMSVRRCADAGLSPWLGLVVLVPLVNLALMLVLCFVPSRVEATWSARPLAAGREGGAKDAAIAVGVSLMIGGLMLLVSVYGFSTYGTSLFLGTPTVMGAASGYVYNRRRPRGWGTLTVGLASVLFAGSALVLFALEGMICVMMAFPLALPLGAFGALIGKAIADSSRRPARELMAAVIVLPLLTAVESMLPSATEYEVLTAVEIDAPAETVWNHVVTFSEINERPEWFFRLGIACPQRARIVGRGVGATRHCEFTTGTFVEPITAWDRPCRLAFDVTEQPEPMFELSPYRHVHPPHLHGYLRSNRGEFRLVPLPGGRTRLEGRTWYEFDMFPQSYWTLWSHQLIHRIHLRVLRHVQRLSESA